MKRQFLKDIVTFTNILFISQDKFLLNQHHEYMMKTILNLFFFYRKFTSILTHFQYFNRIGKYEYAAATIVKAVVLADSLKYSKVTFPQSLFKILKKVDIMNLRGRIYCQYAIFLVELKEYSYSFCQFMLFLRYDLALHFFSEALRQFQQELIFRCTRKVFYMTVNKKKQETDFTTCVVFLAVSLLNQSIVFDIQGNIRKVMDSVKTAKWFVYNYLLDCEGGQDCDSTHNQIKYHKDIQQTVVQYLSVKKQMYVESLKIMMEGERVINYIAKQEGYEIEKKDKFLTMKEQQHIEINKKIYSKFNNEELNNNKLIVIKKNKNKTVYHDLFPKISLQEAKLSYTLLGSQKLMYGSLFQFSKFFSDKGKQDRTNLFKRQAFSMILKKPNSAFAGSQIKGMSKHYDNGACCTNKRRKKKKVKLSFKQRKLRKKAEEEYEPKLITRKQYFEGYEKQIQRRGKRLRRYMKGHFPEVIEKDRQIWKANEVKQPHVKVEKFKKHKKKQIKILDEYMDDLIDKAMKIKEHTNVKKMKFLVKDCLVCHREETKEFHHCFGNLVQKSKECLEHMEGNQDKKCEIVPLDTYYRSEQRKKLDVNLEKQINQTANIVQAGNKMKDVEKMRDKKRLKSELLMEDKYYRLKNSGKPQYMYAHLHKYSKKRQYRKCRMNLKAQYLYDDKQIGKTIKRQLRKEKLKLASLTLGKFQLDKKKILAMSKAQQRIFHLKGDHVLSAKPHMMQSFITLVQNNALESHLPEEEFEECKREEAQQAKDSIMGAMEETIQEIKFAEKCAKMEKVIQTANQSGTYFDDKDDCKIKLCDLMTRRKTLAFIHSQMQKRKSSLQLKKKRGSLSTMENDDDLLKGFI